MDEEKNKKTIDEQMREIWFSSIAAKDGSRYDKETAFEHFLKETSSRKQKETGKRRRIWAISRYAAAIFLMALLLAGAYRMGNEVVKNRFEQILIEAPLGSKTKMVLPDGSSVWLNSGSSIRYSQGFAMDDRRIDLEGEGYFEVVKNAKLPFIVATREMNVEVLGTKFNFRNYSEDEEAWVSLMEGKVGLENRLAGNTKFLSPNEKAVLNKETGEMKISSSKAKNTYLWINDYLFFDEDLLPDIAKELTRSYGVKIRIADPSLNELRFYGYFERKTLKIEKILDFLSSTGKLDYSIENDIIILKQREN